MIYIGLLTDAQKRAGYVVAQDDDFIYLFHRNDGNGRAIAIFPYETATVREIRDTAEHDMKGAKANDRRGEARPLPEENNNEDNS